MTFSLTILGSSSALPTSNRTVTAHVLNVHERFFLIDCGEGTQLQLRKYRFRFSKIHNIFISHLHGDHFYGIFGLLSSMNLMGRKVPLNVFGPPDLKKYLDLHFSATSVNLDYPLVFTPINMLEKSLLIENEHLSVESIPLDHKIECVGFLFKEKEADRKINPDAVENLNLGIRDLVILKKGGDYIDQDAVHYKNEVLTLSPPKARSYAYCSDTRYSEKIIGQIKDFDLLYHEATYLDEMRSRAVVTGHSTAREAATIAHKARVKKLIIGHFSSRYKDLTPLLDEAMEVFPESYLAVEGRTFEIPQNKVEN